MEDIFKIKVKTIKEAKSKNKVVSKQVSSIDSLFREDFLSFYFSKKEKGDK
jgi:hypothetical protein|tara:strand:- start:142 stop:294 length:153 start_codon:yes stop_codon:yes gene_type:complete